MERTVRIHLDAVNKVRYEKPGEFQNSVHRDIYKKAIRMTDLVLKNNGAAEKDSSDESEKSTAQWHNDEQVYNVISILGERGTGKTSAMMSFVTALEAPSSDIFTGTMISEGSFYVLNYIDVTLLDEREGILDVILARMWDRYESVCRIAGKGQKQEIYSTELREQFERVRNSYLLQKRISKGELDESKEISTLHTLHKLAVSMNLRDDFKKLVALYLNFMNHFNSPGVKGGFLVIVIDDIDMASDNVYKFLEQIRRFLTIPQVIIFLTADIKRLQRVCRRRQGTDEQSLEAAYQWPELDYEAEALENKFVNDYLSKLLPHNNRIYMSDLKERDKINSPTYVIEDKFSGISADREKTAAEKKEKELILQYMAKYFHLYFDGKGEQRHFLQHATIRSLVNYFSDLIDAIENNQEEPGKEKGNLEKTERKLEWFKQDLRYRLIEELLAEDQKKQFHELFYLEPEEINGELINYIWRYLYFLDKDKAEIYLGERRKYGADYGLILRGCRLIEEQGIRNRPFIYCVIAFYTMIMTGKKIGLYDRISVLPGGMIQGAWRNSRIYFDSQVNKGIYFSAEKNNLVLEVPARIRKEFQRNIKIPDRAIKRLIEETLKANIGRISIFQMQTLMYRSTDLDAPALESLPMQTKVEFPYISENDRTSQNSSDGIKKAVEETEKADNTEKKASKEKKSLERINQLSITIVSNSLQKYEFGLLNFVDNIYSHPIKQLENWLAALANSMYTGISEYTIGKRNHIENSEWQPYIRKNIAEKLLYTKIRRWGEKYPRQAALPFENVEFMYNLEKKLSQYRMSEEDTDYYKFAKEYYEIIQNQLDEQDKYYESIGIDTNYAACFKECPYIKTFTEPNGNFKRAFQEIFKDIKLVSEMEGKEDDEPLL